MTSMTVYITFRTYVSKPSFFFTADPPGPLVLVFHVNWFLAEEYPGNTTFLRHCLTIVIFSSSLFSEESDKENVQYSRSTCKVFRHELLRMRNQSLAISYPVSRLTCANSGKIILANREQCERAHQIISARQFFMIIAMAMIIISINLLRGMSWQGSHEVFSVEIHRDSTGRLKITIPRVSSPKSQVTHIQCTILNLSGFVPGKIYC